MMVIGMYRGILKGLLLTALVISSVILTYKIWNFRPDFDRLETPTTNNPTSRPTTNDSIKNVFLPFQVVSYSEDNIKGTTEKEILLQYLQRLTSARITEVKDRQNMATFFSRHPDKFIILDYSGDMPTTTYLSQVLNITLDSNTEKPFERMIIDSYSGETITINLLTNDKGVITLKTNINSKTFNHFVKSTQKEMTNYTGIITNQKTTDEKTSIYVPTKPDHKEAFRYLAESINAEDINNEVLGSKDSIIERNGKKNEKIYNSNKGIVTTKDKSLYKYNNLSEVDRKKSKPLDNLMSAYDFVNNHNGFTDDYRYFTVLEDGAINYQMFLKGIPVFDANHLSEINVIWGNKEAYEYRRGLYSTSVAVPTKHEVKTLPSAEAVRYHLASSKYHFESVTNMLVGYYMTKTKNPEIQSTLSFEPAWFVKYNGKWMRYEDGRLQ